MGAFLSFCHHGPGSNWERHTSSCSPNVLNSRDADVVPVMERKCCTYSIRYLKIFFSCSGGVSTDEGLCGGEGGSIRTGSVVAKTEKVEEEQEQGVKRDASPGWRGTVPE